MHDRNATAGRGDGLAAPAGGTSAAAWGHACARCGPIPRAKDPSCGEPLVRRGVGGADSTVRRCRRVAHHRGQLRGSSPLGSFIRRNPMLADGLRLGLIATLNPDSQFDKANRGPYNGPAILAHDARRLAEATSRLRWRNGAPNASGLRPRAWPCYAARSPTLGRMTTTPRDRTPGKAWRVQTSS